MLQKRRPLGRRFFMPDFAETTYVMAVIAQMRGIRHDQVDTIDIVDHQD